jgi:hypothetical protein
MMLLPQLDIHSDPSAMLTHITFFCPVSLAPTRPKDELCPKPQAVGKVPLSLCRYVCMITVQLARVTSQGWTV